MKVISKLALLGSFLLIACGGAEGTLKATEKFNLIDRKAKVHEVAVGDHKVTLSFKESKNRLTIKFEDTDTSVEMNTPENFTIPDNGNFEMRASETNQEVDIFGNVETTEVRTPERYGHEQCQYTSYETVCMTNPNGQTTCHQQPVSRPGWQEVRYYDIETHQKINALFGNSSAQPVGSFASYNAWSQRRITYRGICL